ncbi:MAG: tRNA (cytidine(34)-2'-O)-methyltransferase [Burkholderiales bacterium]|nr:tRNA (cytidine(34)-2'-O)-methyltransferase [Burkholderiales bacterium]
MPDIILFQPDIPQNTGNIIRLCANSGAKLHLVRPLGFPLEDKKLRRAGLDYHEYASIQIHDNWSSCRQFLNNKRIIAIETSGNNYYHKIDYAANDALVFGSETSGLPIEVLNQVDIIAKIPMLAGQRSLNLSNSVALVAYEAWRQLGFNNGV